VEIEVPRLRSGFRLRARTPAKRLKFESWRAHQSCALLLPAKKQPAFRWLNAGEDDRRATQVRVVLSDQRIDCKFRMVVSTAPRMLRLPLEYRPYCIWLL